MLRRTGLGRISAAVRYIGVHLRASAVEFSVYLSGRMFVGDVKPLAPNAACGLDAA